MMNVALKRFSVLALIALFVLVEVQASGPQVDSAASSIGLDKQYWMGLAKNAWQYFQPGVAVDSNTGLHTASVGWPYFSCWDLGTYIFAILDAESLGLISSNGAWGADYRINKIMSWLGTMQLDSNGVPYRWYVTATGQPALSYDDEATNISDYGNLLIALHSLEVAKPTLAATINYLVDTRINSTALASGFVAYSDDYNYYSAHGFADFGYGQYPGVSKALTLLSRLSDAGNVSVYGVELPKTYLTSESLLLGMFNLEPSPLQTNLAYKVYLAQAARYAALGKFTAMSEGNTGMFSPSYIYEWVVTPQGNQWQIAPQSITPIVYLKVAVAFLALYNTSYAAGMVSYLEPLLATHASLFSHASGYMDGIDENGRSVSTVTDETNGMIIMAASYAISHDFTANASSAAYNYTTPNTTNSDSPSTTPNSSNKASSDWFTEALGVGVVVVAGCLFIMLVLMRQRKNHKRYNLTKRCCALSDYCLWHWLNSVDLFFWFC